MPFCRCVVQAGPKEGLVPLPRVCACPQEEPGGCHVREIGRDEGKQDVEERHVCACAAGDARTYGVPLSPDPFLIPGVARKHERRRTVAGAASVEGLFRRMLQRCLALSEGRPAIMHAPSCTMAVAMRGPVAVTCMDYLSMLVQ